MSFDDFPSFQRLLTLVFSLILHLLDFQHVQGEDCLTCSISKLQCTQGCSAYIESPSTVAHCWQTCNLQLNACLAVALRNGYDCSQYNNNNGDGSAGNSAEDPETLEKCFNASGEANFDGNGFLTLDEFKAHTDIFTKEICPDVVLREEYYDDAHFKTYFAQLSCLLCMGVFDPGNPEAVEGDSTTCGCDQLDKPSVDISFPQTYKESVAFCSLVYEMVFVQCNQPVPTCLQACEAKRDECEGDCNALVFYPCVESCEKVTSSSNSVDENGQSGAKTIFSVWGFVVTLSTTTFCLAIE